MICERELLFSSQWILSKFSLQLVSQQSHPHLQGSTGAQHSGIEDHIALPQ